MRNVYEGPFDGTVADELNEPVAFIDGNGRAHREPAAGRFPYRYTFGGWCFAGHGARRGPCGGCFLAPDPDSGDALTRCPLCEAKPGRAA